MQIVIFDWSRGLHLAGTPYEGDGNGNFVVDGSEEDAFRIAGDLFKLGFNVMVLHRGGKNIGTRKNPNIPPISILIQVDDQRFQQR